MTLAALVSVAGTAWQAWALAAEQERETAELAARAEARALATLRDSYVEHVFPVLNACAESGADVANPPGAYTFLEEAATEMSSHPDMHIRMISDYPWPSDRPRVQSAREDAAILGRLRAAPPGTEYAEQVQRGQDEWLVYATQVFMRQGCVDCHNTHPSSPRRDWEAGDFRGAHVVEVRLESQSESTEASPSQRRVAVMALSTISTVLVMLGLAFGYGRSRRSAERAALLRGAVNLSADPAMVFDAENRILLANEAMGELLGLSHSGLVGRELASVVHGQSQAQLLATLQLSEGIGGNSEQPSIELDLLNAAGEMVPVGMTANRVSLATGTYILAALRDLRPSRKRQERQLREEKMRVLGQVVAGVAHDFNNLLMVITSATESLDEHATSDQLAPLGEVKRASRHAAGLVGYMLDFSRNQQLRPTRLSVTATTEKLSAVWRRILGSRLRLRVTVDSECWDIRVDRQKFESIMLNILVNARDAIEGDGEVHISARNVTAEGEQVGDFVEIVCRDTGTGIDAEVLARVFEPFYTTKGGTGLGLSSAQGFALQSGGDIRVESGVNSGTSVFLRLPRAVGADSASPAGPDSDPPTDRLKLLVVDDHPTVARAMSRLARLSGHQVECATSADEALDQHGAAAAFDVVVSDFHMPGMDGLEFAGKLRAMGYEGGFLLVSGAFPEELAEQAVSQRVHVLAKPFDRTQFDDALTVALEAAPPSILHPES